MEFSDKIDIGISMKSVSPVFRGERIFLTNIRKKGVSGCLKQELTLFAGSTVCAG